MKKKLLSILLLLASCGSPKQEEVLIHDINVDFPTADTVALEQIQTFEFKADSYNLRVKDTVLFAMGSNNENMGYCYNINNGNLITPIINRGNAANEIISPFYSLTITSHKDRIQFIDHNLREIKSISMDDVLTKDMGERKLLKMVVPEIVKSSQYKMIDNGIVIGQNYKHEKDLRYFILDGNEFTEFGEYDKRAFISDFDPNLTPNIVSSKSTPIFVNSGSKVVVGLNTGIALDLIDIDTKSIVKSRFYTKITIRKQSNDDSVLGMSEMNIDDILCTDKEIYCIVKQKDKVKSKEKGKKFVDLFILVFDWNLNPVKKYYIGSFINYQFNVCMSADCEKIYYLTIGDEKQELFEGIIN